MAKIDRGHLHDMWELMPVEIQETLKSAIDSLTIKQTFPVSACPRCGDRNTTDCHDLNGISDPSIGICITCGYVWCIECDTHLISNIVCGHWKICARCAERKEGQRRCGILPRDCRYIRIWKEKNNPTV